MEYNDVCEGWLYTRFHTDTLKQNQKLTISLLNESTLHHRRDH